MLQGLTKVTQPLFLMIHQSTNQYLWVALKDRLYEREPQTLDELQEGITRCTQQASREFFPRIVPLFCLK